MSSAEKAIRQPAASASMFGRGPMAGIGMPTQKAKDFKGTLRRLVRMPARTGPRLVIVVAAGVLATVFSVIGPKLLGLATTKIFEGYLGRANGTSMAGIDFGYVGRHPSARSWCCTS